MSTSRSAVSFRTWSRISTKPAPSAIALAKRSNFTVARSRRLISTSRPEIR
ncbi:MAG: hypothetical protein V4475_01705 [Pseudomonadota bacterium]